MKAGELKKLLADIDDDVDVVASVSYDDLTYTGLISSGGLGRIDDEANVTDLDFCDEDDRKNPLVYELFAFVGEGWEDDYWDEK